MPVEYGGRIRIQTKVADDRLADGNRKGGNEGGRKKQRESLSVTWELLFCPRSRAGTFGMMYCRKGVSLATEWGRASGMREMNLWISWMTASV